MSHIITYSGSASKLFTGSGEISFRALEQNFRGPSTNNVKLSDYKRVTSATASDPTVPDSGCNTSINTTNSDLQLEDYRNSIKEIEITYNGTTATNYNADAPWVDTDAQTALIHQDLPKNIKKKHILPSGKAAHASSAGNNAMVFDPAGDTNNLDIEIRGSVIGRSGGRGNKNSNGSNGGNALYLNPGGGGKIDVRVFSGGLLAGGGGGGAGGFDGIEGNNGSSGNSGNSGSSNTINCTNTYEEKNRTQYSRNRIVTGRNRNRCHRRGHGWGGRRARSRCRNNVTVRSNCPGTPNQQNCPLNVGGMQLVDGRTTNSRNSNSCRAYIVCRYVGNSSATGNGGNPGNAGNGGTKGNKGTASHGGHGAGVYASGVYTSGQPDGGCNVGNTGNPGNAGNSGGSGNCSSCRRGNFLSRSTTNTCGNSGNSGNSGNTGNSGTDGTCGMDGGNYGQAGGNNARYSGGSAGKAAHGRTSHYQIINQGGTVAGSTS